MGAIVTDAKGRFVGTLRKENFHIFDDGVEQPITNFAAIEEPAQVLMLVESGPAVYMLEGGHLQAAYRLLNGLSADDRVAVAGYAERLQPVLEFTTDKRRAAAALDALRFNLGIGELNLAASLNSALDLLSLVQGKKTVVLLSTGVDTSPADAAESLLARLRASDVRVLAVALGAELREAKPNPKQKVPPEKVAAAEEGFAKADAWLRALAEATGGRVYFPKNAKEFAAAYAEIAEIVRHEYSLGFAPAARDGKMHSIEVRVGAAGIVPGAPTDEKSRGLKTAATGIPLGYRVDHRRAYVAPAP